MDRLGRAQNPDEPALVARPDLVVPGDSAVMEGRAVAVVAAPAAPSG